MEWAGAEPKLLAPDDMTDVWTYTVLRQAGRPGVRCLGGRVMFYVKGESKPVKVDGTFTVYAFDATDKDPNMAMPEKKFVFLPDQLDKHYSKSDLGHSYSFWIPWNEVGGPQREIRLLARFEAASGEKTIVGEGSQHVLPGALAQTDAQLTQFADQFVHNRRAARVTIPVQRGVVQQVGHQVPLGPPPKKVMTTATINLPPSMARRFLSGEVADQTPTTPETTRATVQSTGAMGGFPALAEPPTASVPPAQFRNPPAQPVSPPSAQAPIPGMLDRSTTRFAPPRFPARRATSVGPRSDPVRRQPHPAAWPSRLPPTPRSGWSDVWNRTSESVVPTGYSAPAPMVY